MMTLLIAVVLILLGALVGWIVNQIPMGRVRPVCPICMGVASAWVVLIVGIYAGVTLDPTVPAILMGGSVVGIMYTKEKKAGILPLWFKIWFTVVGFVTVYMLLSFQWLWFALGVLVLVAMYVLTEGSNQKSGGSRKILDRLKDCC